MTTAANLEHSIEEMFAQYDTGLIFTNKNDWPFEGKRPE
jgi:hypothetical protein